MEAEPLIDTFKGSWTLSEPWLNDISRWESVRTGHSGPEYTQLYADLEPQSHPPSHP